jgi:hypothetical protein
MILVEPHLGQAEGREHSVILLGGKTVLLFEGRFLIVFKHAFDFTYTRSR